MSMAVVGIMRGGMRAVGCGTLVCASLNQYNCTFIFRLFRLRSERASGVARGRSSAAHVLLAIHRSVSPSFISFVQPSARQDARNNG